MKYICRDTGVILIVGQTTLGTWYALDEKYPTCFQAPTEEIIINLITSMGFEKMVE